MRNQIVLGGNQWIKVRGKGASVSRPWFKLDYFHQYLETIDGVLVQLFLSSSFDHNIMLLHLIIGINSILSKLQCMSRPSPGSDQFPVVTRSGPAPDISGTAHLNPHTQPKIWNIIVFLVHFQLSHFLFNASGPFEGFFKRAFSINILLFWK